MPIVAQRGKANAPKDDFPLFGGVAVGVDLLGVGMRAFSPNADMGIMARVNLKDKFFPILEAGIGTSRMEGADNGNIYRTTAPYFRLGVDYNINKKHNGNRLFAGARVGVSMFNFDFINTQFNDPVWHTSQPLKVEGQRADAEWLDLTIGLETRLWRFIRLGYSLRYRFMIHMGGNQYGDPCYIPGFGKNSAPFGGTINLVFELDKKMLSRKHHKAAKKSLPEGVEELDEIPIDTEEDNANEDASEDTQKRKIKQKEKETETAPRAAKRRERK